MARPGLGAEAASAWLIAAAVAGLAGIVLAVARSDYGGAVLIAMALAALVAAYRWGGRRPPSEK